jgi:hypothetical protein
MVNYFLRRVLALILVVAFALSVSALIYISKEDTRIAESLGWNSDLLSRYETIMDKCEPQLKEGGNLRDELLSGKAVIIHKFDNGGTNGPIHFEMDHDISQGLKIPHSNLLVDTPDDVSIIIFTRQMDREAGKYTDGYAGYDEGYFVKIFNIKTNKIIFEDGFWNLAPRVKTHSSFGHADTPDRIQILNDLVG